MEFKILELVGPVNTFMLEISFVHGDGDFYSKEEIVIGIDPNNAAPIIRKYAESDNNSPFLPLDSEYSENRASVRDIKLFWYNV